jgi:hypothetical protein
MSHTLSNTVDGMTTGSIY